MLNRLVNYARMHGALLADLARLTPRRLEYAPVSWAAAQTELEYRYPASARFLTEQALLDLENQVTSTFQHVGARSRRAISLNADLTLARCLYLICRSTKPLVVIETGVAYGVSSAYLLQALAVNGAGVLHSIDLPLPGGSNSYIGSLVPDHLRSRWHLHLASSRRELPKLVKSLNVDFFVHDSLHTYRNMRFEFGVVWPHLTPGGLLVADDIDGNDAFGEFVVRTDIEFWRIVAESTKEAAFGFAVKASGSVPVTLRAR